MANGDTQQVQVSTPDGKVWSIPKQNLAKAQLRGAKVVSSKPAEPKGTIAKIASATPPVVRGSILGAFSGLGIPETQTPIQDLGKGVVRKMGEIAKTVAEHGPAEGGLIEGGKMVKGAAESLYGAGKEVYAGYKQKDPEMMAHGAASGVSQLAQLAEVRKLGKEPIPHEAPEVIAQQSKGLAQRALDTILNTGPSHEKMQMLQDADALGTKAKLAHVESAVKTDASNLMQKVSTGIDEKFPQGSVDGAAVAEGIKKDIGQFVKAKTLKAKLPPSIQKILDEAGGTTGGKTPVRLSNSELQTLNVLHKAGARGDALRGSLSEMGYAPKQIDAMMQVSGGVEGGPKLWTFEQGKQLRTELGDELFTGGAEKYPGAVRKAMFNAWENLTERLGDSAQKAGLLPDWLRARAKSKAYYDDFHGTYDRGKYNQSPIGKSLSGATGQDIMEPLSGKSAQQARDILRKYSQYGIDPKDIIRDVRRYGTNSKIMKFASPSKWDIIIGGMALYRPEWGIPAFIARYGLPRLAEKIASMRATEMQSARPTIPVAPEP
jgi:hypothetical protein